MYNPENYLAQDAEPFLSANNCFCSFVGTRLCFKILILSADFKDPIQNRDRVTYSLCPLYSFTLIFKVLVCTRRCYSSIILVHPTLSELMTEIW